MRNKSRQSAPQSPSPVVVDGRVTDEKLGELLAIATEHDELDFKANYDLSDAKKKLDFVKDCVAMMNTPSGGYIVIGVDGRGNPAKNRAAVDTSRFDPADLAALVEKYVDAEVSIRSAFHERDGRDIVLVFIGPTVDGIPVPTSKLGEQGGTRSFEAGVFFTRESTRNVTVKAKHMPRLLRRYRDIVREEAHLETNRVIAQFVEQFQQSGALGGPEKLPPLVSGADLSTLAAAVTLHLQEGGSIGLDRFIRKSTERSRYGQVQSGHEMSGVDALSVVAIQSLHSKNRTAFERAVLGLVTIYESAEKIDTFGSSLKEPRDIDIAKFWLDIISRAMLIGAVAVVTEQWWAVPVLALRPNVDQHGYRYESWFRHAGVFAARAGLIPDRAAKLPAARPGGSQQHAGPLLSSPRILAIEQPELRDGIAAPSGTGDQDELLDSLAQFDFAWCVIAAVAGRAGDLAGEDFYPSCAALEQSRAQPMISRIALDFHVRRALSVQPNPWELDREAAWAIRSVMTLAVEESTRFGTAWQGLSADPAVQNFVVDKTS